MPNLSQLSQQSFFSVSSSTISTPQNVQVVHADPTMPNANFGGKARKRRPKVNKPWNSNTSTFRVPQGSPTGPVVDTSPIDAQPSESSPFFTVHGLPTPETPSSTYPDWNGQYRSFSRGYGFPDFRNTSPGLSSGSYLDQNISPTPSLRGPNHESPLMLLDYSVDDCVLRTGNTRRFAEPSPKNINVPPPHTVRHQIDPLLSPLCLEINRSRSSEHHKVFDDQKENIAPEEAIPHRYQKHRTKLEIIQAILKTLADERISLTGFLTTILDEPIFMNHQAAFYSESNEAAFEDLLERLWNHRKGSLAMRGWLQPYAIDLVCDLVYKEMDKAKPHLQMTTNQVTPEFIANWNINELMGSIGKNVTPVWTRILDAATETRVAKSKGQKSGSKNRKTGRSVISAQVHFLRSFASSKIQIGLGLMAWSTGASRQLINMLNKSCLSVSYNSISNIIKALADRSIEDARRIAAGPHGLGYDNINMSSSIFVEQAPGSTSKVQSGTFGVIYEFLNASEKDMELAPMILRLKESSPLKITDLRPSLESIKSYQFQTAVNISKILFKYEESFTWTYKNHPELQNKPRRCIPKDHKTKFYPVRCSTIEEASIKGNVLVHDDIYLVQLKLKAENLNKRAIVAIHDQLTNARNHSVQAMRNLDTTPWNRREIFQLAFGIFHLIMSLIWALLNIHRGTITQHGSLAHLFAVIEKVRLSAEHPDFHSLLAALTQILEGLILNALQKECEFPSLEEYAKSNPTPAEILVLCYRIISKHATPEEPIPPSDKKEAQKKAAVNDEAECSTEESDDSTTELEPATTSVKEDSTDDPINENVVRLTRDLLYVTELVQAVADGDFGRVEDILPDLACIFRGAGSNNYSTEILHLLFNIKEVWTPEFANIVRDNILVTISGVEGRTMGMDLNIEHLIRYLKALFAAKGIYSNWDRLGNISAAINHLQAIKKQVTRSMHSNYQGSTRKAVDTRELGRRIAAKARELRLQEHIPNRDPGQGAPLKRVPDLRASGRQKFASSSLATFNKKIRDLIDGKAIATEDDDLPALQFAQDGAGVPDDVDEDDEANE